MWYSLVAAHTKSKQSYVQIFINALTFQGKKGETMENFVLLVLLPALTVYFYITGGTHIELPTL